MASYKVILKPSFEKDLRALPKSAITRVIKALDLLAVNPFPRQSLKLEGGEQLYRLLETIDWYMELIKSSASTDSLCTPSSGSVS